MFRYMHQRKPGTSDQIVNPEIVSNLRNAPLVIKIGGSLFDQIPALIPHIKSSDSPLLIVPGGGPFAERVRQMTLDDDSAHWMAIAGMEQYGWFIGSHGFPCTDILALPKTTSVLLPYRILRQNDPLPHSWNITSDTISAWIAMSLKAELLVLKSVNGIFIDGTLQQKLKASIQTETVDPCFLDFVLKNHVRTMIINGRHPERLKAFLDGSNVPGTAIDVTF